MSTTQEKKLDRKHIRDLLKLQDECRERESYWKTKEGKHIPVPKLVLKNLPSPQRKDFKRRYITESDSEEDMNEKIDMWTKFNKLCGDISEEDLDKYRVQFLQEKELEDKNFKEFNKELRFTILSKSSSSSQPFSEDKVPNVCREMKRSRMENINDPIPSTSGGSNLSDCDSTIPPPLKRKKRTGGGRPKKMRDEDDMSIHFPSDFQHTPENIQIQSDILEEVQKIWDITRKFRWYTIHLTQEKLDCTFEKFITTFDDTPLDDIPLDSLPIKKRRLRMNIPILDVTEKTEDRMFTTRLRSFQLTPQWTVFLNHMSWIPTRTTTQGGIGLEKFFENVCRIKGDIWTPKYQNVSICLETLEDFPGINYNVDTKMKIHVLVGREETQTGRDVDSRAYKYVMKNFDPSIQVDCVKCTFGDLNDFFTLVGTQNNNRTFCGSTDYRIVECVQEIRNLTEPRD